MYPTIEPPMSHGSGMLGGTGMGWSDYVFSIQFSVFSAWRDANRFLTFDNRTALHTDQQPLNTEY
jgi:hypothetical protein